MLDVASTPLAGCDALCVQVLGDHPPVKRVHAGESLCTCDVRALTCCRLGCGYVLNYCVFCKRVSRWSLVGLVGFALLLAVVLSLVHCCFDSWVFLGLLCFLCVKSYHTPSQSNLVKDTIVLHTGTPQAACLRGALYVRLGLAVIVPGFVVLLPSLSLAVPGICCFLRVTHCEVVTLAAADTVELACTRFAVQRHMHGEKASQTGCVDDCIRICRHGSILADIHVAVHMCNFVTPCACQRAVMIRRHRCGRARSERAREQQ